MELNNFYGWGNQQGKVMSESAKLVKSKRFAERNRLDP